MCGAKVVLYGGRVGDADGGAEFLVIEWEWTGGTDVLRHV